MEKYFVQGSVYTSYRNATGRGFDCNTTDSNEISDAIARSKRRRLVRATAGKRGRTDEYECPTPRREPTPYRCRFGARTADATVWDQNETIIIVFHDGICFLPISRRRHCGFPLLLNIKNIFLNRFSVFTVLGYLCKNYTTFLMVQCAIREKSGKCFSRFWLPENPGFFKQLQ